MFDLNEFMGFDNVIRSNGDGTFEDVSEYAPEVYLVETEHGVWQLEGLTDGWEYLTGFTGQYGAASDCPLMHASEYIGGGLAEHIANVPGLYVAAVAYPMPLDDDEDPVPDLWVVIYREEEGK